LKYTIKIKIRSSGYGNSNELNDFFRCDFTVVEKSGTPYDNLEMTSGEHRKGLALKLYQECVDKCDDVILDNGPFIAESIELISACGSVEKCEEF